MAVPFAQQVGIFPRKNQWKTSLEIRLALSSTFCFFIVKSTTAEPCSLAMGVQHNHSFTGFLEQVACNGQQGLEMAQCSKHHDKFLATVMMVSHFISGYFLSYIPIFMIRTSKCLPLITIKRNTLCFVIMVV